MLLQTPARSRCASFLRGLGRLSLPPQCPRYHRSFFTLPSFSSEPQPRTLTATKILPYPPLPLFHTISDVGSYASFLPFLSASTVTSRHPLTGLPTSAYLTAGYGPFSGTFLSRVNCDQETWTVAAKSGGRVEENEIAKLGLTPVEQERAGLDGNERGLFKFLDTIWQLKPIVIGDSAPGGNGGGCGRVPETEVHLQLNFQVRSAAHAAVMSAVDSQVAAMMIEAFERRMSEVSQRSDF